MNPYFREAPQQAAPENPENGAPQNPSVCKACGAALAADDKAIYMKLISRNASSFLCIDCLGAQLGCGRGPIEERIRYYRESGNCTLFR